VRQFGRQIIAGDLERRAGTKGIAQILRAGLCKAIRNHLVRHPQPQKLGQKLLSVDDRLPQDQACERLRGVGSVVDREQRA
jgi:hypothetical protein